MKIIPANELCEQYKALSKTQLLNCYYSASILRCLKLVSKRDSNCYNGLYSSKSAIYPFIDPLDDNGVIMSCRSLYKIKKQSSIGGLLGFMDVKYSSQSYYRYDDEFDVYDTEITLDLLNRLARFRILSGLLGLFRKNMVLDDFGQSLCVVIHKKTGVIAAFCMYDDMTFYISITVIGVNQQFIEMLSVYDALSIITNTFHNRRIVFDIYSSNTQKSIKDIPLLGFKTAHEQGVEYGYIFKS